MAANNTALKRVRVVLADDNAAIRELVIRLLDSEYDFVASFEDGRALVEGVQLLSPELAIVDISMPVMNGLQAAAEISRLNLAVRIVFLTVNEDSDFVRAAFDAGGSAYVAKRNMASDLPIAMRAVLEGGEFISAGCELALE